MLTTLLNFICLIQNNSAIFDKSIMTKQLKLAKMNEPKKVELNENNILVQVTETQFTWIEKCKSEKWGDFELKTELHTTTESANTAAGIACKNWGSNLVYLGTLQYEINGQIFYNPTFNVWD